MKYISNILLAGLAVVAAAACNKLPDGGRSITIEAGIGSLTKVATDGNKAAFEAGDKLTLYAWTGSASEVPATRVVDGIVNTFDGSKWTPAAQMLWEDNASAHYFLGVSPARTITDFKADSYVLNPADYAGSDLLIATNLGGLTSEDNPVPLVFGHATARLDVNLSFRSQWASAPTVSAVSATAKKTATVDYLDGTMSATGEASDLSLARKSNTFWSGLQIPQTGVQTITVLIDGRAFIFNHTTDIPLVAGKFTTINLTVGRDEIELASDITIADWTPGASLSGDALDE